MQPLHITTAFHPHNVASVTIEWDGGQERLYFEADELREQHHAGQRALMAYIAAAAGPAARNELCATLMFEVPVRLDGRIVLPDTLIAALADARHHPYPPPTSDALH